MPAAADAAGRRRWLGVAVAAAAGSAGLGWSLMRAPAAPAPAPALSSAEALGDDFWRMAFERPDGTPLDLSGLRGQPLILNFWATWCPPCVKEMPLFEQFWTARRAQGWRVLGLAVDGPTPVREFLKRQPVTFPVGLAGLVGTDLSRTLGNDKGGLPYTVVVGADSRIRHRQMGETTAEELQAWAAKVTG